MLRNDIYRIIDANINRASEALRVLEDWARFSNQHSALSTQHSLTEKLKKIRHELNKIFSPFTNLILSRDSVQDVGRDIDNSTNRKTIRDIIRANCKRLEESLRVLSEYGQILGVDIKSLENSRYEIYTMEKELIKNEKLIRLNNACLYLVTNRDGFNSDIDFLNVVEKSICGGVDIIQLREKNETERKILELAKEIRKLISGTDVLFIINDRIDIALAADADGVHLGQDDLPLDAGRKITPEGFIIGLSTHSIEQGKGLINQTLTNQTLTNQTLTPDYIGVGPVFQTPTKPDYKPSGLEYVKWASENINEIPFFVIGGINEINIDKVIHAGAKRIAVVRAIMNAKDPLQATQNFVGALHATSLENKKSYAETR